MIRDGEVEPGDQLPSERDLMREFGVGRPAVREALFHLRKMGLVEIALRRAGARHAADAAIRDRLARRHGAPHARRARTACSDFQNARSFFEVGLARHAAQHATDEDLARLRGGARGQPPVARRSRQVRADRRRLPLRAGGHPAQSDLHGDPCGASPNGWWSSATITLPPGAGRRSPTRRTGTIFEAVAARDPDRAEHAMRAHLDHVAQLLLRMQWRRRHERLRRSSSISG